MAAPVPPDEETCIRAFELHAEGQNPKYIAEQLSIGVSTCYRYIKRGGELLEMRRYVEASHAREVGVAVAGALRSRLFRIMDDPGAEIEDQFKAAELILKAEAARRSWTVGADPVRLRVSDDRERPPAVEPHVVDALDHFRAVQAGRREPLPLPPSRAEREGRTDDDQP